VIDNEREYAKIFEELENYERGTKTEFYNEFFHRVKIDREVYERS
jgi:hypothetical protein